MGGMMKIIGFVDKKTGEYCESYVAVIQPKRRNGFDRGWAAMGFTAFDYMVGHRKQLGEEGFAVFLKLVSKMDVENFIQINQTQVAKSMGMKQPNVARAIKSLMKIGVILEGPKVGRCRTYRLNPHVGWKGSASNHKEALKKSEHLKLVYSNSSDDQEKGDLHLQKDIEDM